FPHNHKVKSRPRLLAAHEPLTTAHRLQNPCRTSSSTVSELSAGSRLIIFSTYFAIRSASRFTASPGLSELRFVISTVCGMMATLQILPSSFATVRLMPSIEIEPLYTVYFSTSLGNSICSHQFSEPAMRSRLISLPTPSTWPCTMWPPKRPSAFMGSSRFTIAPSCIREKDVRTQVSGARSAPNEPDLISSAVRQTPLTDT